MPAILSTDLTDLEFSEPHERFCVIRHEELPEARKAEYRIAGINPDRAWSLVWSFANLEDAEKQAADDRIGCPAWLTIAVVDMAHCPMNLTGADRDEVKKRFFETSQF